MKLNGKRILVTGSSGFVGRNLVAELKRHDVEVVTLTDQEGHRIDVRDWRKIKEITDIDLVYHLAAKTYVPFSFENPREIYEVNVLGTLNILELCRLREVEKMVFVSSYVYGQPRYLPIDEKYPLQPTNPYMRSKVLGEELCRAYNNDFGLRCIILRPFNVYGVGQSGDLLIPTIIAQLQAGKIELTDSVPKRDYVYISDLISALIEAGKFDSDFEIFNIGYGKSYSVKEIVDKIVQLYGKEVKINYKNERRKNEIMDVVAEIKKAKARLGWEPRVSFEEGLRRCIDWFKEREGVESKRVKYFYSEAKQVNQVTKYEKNVEKNNMTRVQRRGMLPKTEYVGEHEVTLPLHLLMDEEGVKYTATCIQGDYNDK